MAKSKVRFEERLVLFNWLLNLFGKKDFQELANPMKDPDLEGVVEDGVSRYHDHIPRTEELTRDILLEYDANILRHWNKITERRNRSGHNLKLKYFQYLALLFTEVYLDRFFSNPTKLLKDVEAFRQEYNAKNPEAKVPEYCLDDLRKIAFWSATGSGKTLLMHVNILQYKHYLSKHRRERELNRIILLTPNEGLSRQHLEEFMLSGFSDTAIFNKDNQTRLGSYGIEIIDIHKLREKSGNKTVAVEAFEGNNLVLVDEGHRGSSNKDVGQWMEMRNRLCERGFSFEYSATFGQAMSTSSNDLQDQYAKCILFDYSYRYFYEDGYGKDYNIFNLENDNDEAFRQHYLTACLLAFYQQQILYNNKRSELRRFLIEKPLWIFVGGTVTKGTSTKDVSDVLDILLYISHFINNKDDSIRYIDLLLKNQANLRDSNGQELFASAFTYLHQQGKSAKDVFSDILQTLFNTPTSGILHVLQLKGEDAKGEVALHVGEGNDPFGVINVGDPGKLNKLCEEHPEELVVGESDFNESLFHNINSSDSTVNILIGSKKFSEGWSSWRVSTMGLMNVGKNQGSQIIQLFGRGVRLKGLDFCLKRTNMLKGIRNLPSDIRLLETLNVFGIHADYMKQFKDYLEREGFATERVEFILPVVKNLGNKKLKMIRLKEGVDFKKQGEKPRLVFDENIKIVVDWYPKIGALASAEGRGDGGGFEKNTEILTSEIISFIDVSELYFRLQQFKEEKLCHNLNLSKEEIYGLLLNENWYELRIPQEVMEAVSYERVRIWQEIASALLLKYCERLYKRRKAEFEKTKYEVKTLDEDDPNFLEEYLFLIEKSRQDIIDKLHGIKEVIERGELKDFKIQGLTALFLSNHLYQPLVYVDSDMIEVKPVSLNEGERDFVLDLKDHYEDHNEFYQDKELYLLRNLSRGRGIGFFEAGNFYPDFIMWLVSKDKQYVNFVDPKGIRNLRGRDDPKIRFSKDVKQLEVDSDLVLNSYIISNTPYREIDWWGCTKEELEEKHVLFQQDNKATYIWKLLDSCTAEGVKADA